MSNEPLTEGTLRAYRHHQPGFHIGARELALLLRAKRLRPGVSQKAQRTVSAA